MAVRSSLYLVYDGDKTDMWNIGRGSDTNMIMAEMFAHFHPILNWCQNHFFQLLKVLGVNNVRQPEIHTAEPLVPDYTASKDEMAIA